MPATWALAGGLVLVLVLIIILVAFTGGGACQRRRPRADWRSNRHTSGRKKKQHKVKSVTMVVQTPQKSTLSAPVYASLIGNGLSLNDSIGGNNINVYESSGYTTPMHAAYLEAPSASPTYVNFQSSVPLDADATSPPIITLHFVSVYQGSTITTGNVALSVARSYVAAGALFPATPTYVSTLVVTNVSDAPTTYAVVPYTATLQTSDTFTPEQLFVISVVRAGSQDTYANTLYLTAIEFRYKIRQQTS